MAIHRPGPACPHPCCQGALFPLPPRPKPKMAANPQVARYARYRPRVRSLCDDCIRAIHELGIEKAPFPRAVRWRRTAQEGTTHLCEFHKDERMETEQ
jgi:hypothetical protein